MDEIDFYLDLCTKEDMVRLITLNDVRVRGFSKNFNSAPEIILKNALKKDLSKKGGKHFTYLVKNSINKYDSFNITDFNSFLLKINKFKDNLTEPHAFLLFLNKFQEKKDDYLPIMIENKKNNIYIFDIEIKNPDITKTNVNDLFLSFSGINSLYNKFYNDYRDSLCEYMLKTVDDAQYRECEIEVKDISWIEFVEKYPNLIRKYEDKIIYMAYLTVNKNNIIKNEDEQIKFIHFLLIYDLVLEIEVEQKNDYKNIYKKKAFEIKELKEKMNNWRDKAIKDEKLYKQIKEKNKEIKEDYNKDFQEKLEILDYKDTVIKKLKDDKKQIKKELKEIKYQCTSKIENLSKKLKNIKKIDDYFSQWGYTQHETKLAIISYEDSDLYKLFFDKYIYINSGQDSSGINFDLANCDNSCLIVINKANMSTKKLFSIERILKNNKRTNKLVTISYNPKELIKDILINKGEEI